MEPIRGFDDTSRTARGDNIIIKRDLGFLVALSKDLPKPTVRPNWMGIGVNSSKIAVSVIGKGKVGKKGELYVAKKARTSLG